ncbi:hypothetical protein MUY35_15080 [Aliiroseovarius sp. S1339]|uniref:DUF6538 domain-containing protein n=1 Tax=Aliiroseovarius sp. S1339 TaxID=2936990 RepID=UPI0020BDF993|nr:DUF6538 domain-containing protein [Aliiroseovarius sp. S1339]MCK8465181.1 hypothetical protein [Aliiroseovarius sp. S1339]
MTGLNHVTRRGAVYIWRRRLPARVSKTSYIQISFRTSRFSTAKILANIVNSGFEACNERMKSKRITKTEAQRFLSDLVAQKLEQIEEERYYEPDAPTPEEWWQRYLAQRSRAVASRLVAARGCAAELLPEDNAELGKGGYSEQDLSCIHKEIAALKTEIATPEYEASSRAMAEADLGRPDCDAPALRAVRSLRLVAQAEALERFDRRKVASPYPNLDLDLPPAISDHLHLVNLDPPKPLERRRYSDEITSIVSD